MLLSNINDCGTLCWHGFVKFTHVSRFDIITIFSCMWDLQRVTTWKSPPISHFLVSCWWFRYSSSCGLLYYLCLKVRRKKSPLRLSWFILWCQVWGQLDQTTARAAPYKGWYVWIKSMRVVTVTEESLIWAQTPHKLGVSVSSSCRMCVNYNNCYIDGRQLTTKLQAFLSTWAKI